MLLVRGLQMNNILKRFSLKIADAATNLKQLKEITKIIRRINSLEDFSMTVKIKNLD